MDVLTIICDEVIKSNEEEIKTSSINFTKKKVTQSFYSLVAFLLITIAY